MALDVETLAKQITEVFGKTVVEDPKDYPKPDEMAAALAKVIYDFVRNGVVTGIVSEFTGEVKIKIPDSATELTGTVTGTATQSKPVNIT